MKKLTLTQTITIDYDLNGTDPKDLRERLTNMVLDAKANCAITGDSPATIERWQTRIDGTDKMVTAKSGTRQPSYDDPQDPSTIALWLSRLPGDARVHIDDDGLCLVRTGRESTYLEIGGHEPEKTPLSLDDFVTDGLYGDTLDPRIEFRKVCQESDGDQVDEGEWCRLEKSDMPAFRMGMNDYADSMQKDRQWVTFDNGSTYWTADAVKAAIAHFDGCEDEFEYDKDLKDIISFWI